MQRLLYLKPWSLFLLLVLPIFFAEIDAIGAYISPVFALVYYGWIYAIGISMNRRIPAALRPNTTYFTISCIYCTLIYLLGSLFGIYLPENIFVLVPVVVYSLWSLFYIFMFAAQMLESVIEGELVSRSDSLKAFLCIWFFFIGLWQVQRTVQRVLKSKPLPTV